MYCSALQHVAMCCSVLQCVALCCSVLQCDAMWYIVERRARANMRAHIHKRTHIHIIRVFAFLFNYVCEDVCVYRVAKTHRIPYLYRSFSAKVTCI